MKKRILSFIIFVVVAFAGLFNPFYFGKENNDAHALDVGILQDIKQNLENFMTEGEEKARFNRTAGTEGEKEAAKYIAEQMNLLASFYAYNQEQVDDITNTNVTEEDLGLSYFQFESLYTGDNLRSQNVIFIKYANDNPGREKGKKVVLTANYDNNYDQKDENKKPVKSHGVNDNISGVVALISLCQILDTLEFNFDIEVIFFGASRHNLAGSGFYTAGYDTEESKNTLLAVTLSKLCAGDYLYVYSEEYKNKYEPYALDKFNAVQVNAFLSFSSVFKINSYTSANGFPFSHVGIDGDNANFLRLGINSLHVFSGNYEKVLDFGISESDTKPNISGTVNDNLEYLEEHYSSTYLKNLVAVVSGLNVLLTDANFTTRMQGATMSADRYDFWTNSKYPLFMLVILMVLLFSVYYFISNRLTYRARYVFNTINDGKPVNFMNIISKQIEQSDDKLMKENKEIMSEYIQRNIEEICDVSDENEEDDKHKDDN